MILQSIVVLTIVFAVVSCAPVTVKKSASNHASATKVVITPVSHTVNGMTEVVKLKAAGHEVIVTLNWRNYSKSADASVATWYGDMGSPPPKFVAKSLTVSVDGKGVAIPVTKYRYLATQWMNGAEQLGAFQSGKNLNIYVNLGDGAEAWTANYVIDPAAGTLVSHKVYDAGEFHNDIAP